MNFCFVRTYREKEVFSVSERQPPAENKMGVMPVNKLLLSMSIPMMVSMLVQALYNVVDNALKYTPAGGVIRLRARRAKDGGATIEVQDSGIGISREDVSRVFDRFYRSDPARGRNSGGAGLGLSIARWIVESHGGHFEVLSREGIGTRFTVVLPPPKQPPERR